MNDDGDKYAFPKLPDEIRNGSYGMTLRDYFAAKALAGLCAYSGSYGAPNGPGDLAERSYQIADAMIEARNA